jgi:hypothetical protein
MDFRDLDTNSKSQHFFPQIHFLQLIYARKSNIHGLSHVLRVWIIGYLLSLRYLPSKVDVITASTLLHDIGRKRDFWDKEHGKQSAKWIYQFLPLITEHFSSEEINQIANLASKHNLDDDCPCLALKILKDADALDRCRLKIGQLDPCFLRLDYSHELIDLAQDLFDQWQQLEKQNLSPFEILQLSTKKLNIYSYLPLKLRQQISLANPESLTHEVELAEVSIENGIKGINKLKEKLENNSLKYAFLREFEEYLRNIESSIFKNEFVRKITINYIKQKMQPTLRYALYDHTYTRSIKNTLKTFFKYSLHKEKTFMYPSDESVLFEIIKKKKRETDCQIFNAIETHLTRYGRYKKLLFLYSLIGKKYPPILDFIFLSHTRNKNLDKYIYQPQMDEIKQNTALWLEVSSFYIKNTQIKSLLGNSQEKIVKKLIEASFNIIKDIFDSVDTDLSIYIKCTRQLRTISKIAAKNNLDDINQQITDIWQQNTKYMKLLPKFTGGKVSFFANVFNLYTKEDKSISRLVNEQLKLFRQLAHCKADINSLISYYIAPLAISPFFEKVDQVQLREFIKYINDLETKQSLKRWIPILQDRDKDNDIAFERILDYCKRYSQQNFDEIIRILNINPPEPETIDFENFQIAMNISGVEVLKNIAKDGGEILSLWNILGLKNFCTKTKIFKNFINPTFEDMACYRDSLQRIMNIRFPNTSNLHGKYSSLLDKKSFFGKSERSFDLDRIAHYPLETFIKRSYGKITIFFKDEIKKRCIFVFFDSFWKFRNLIVDFKHAAILKKILVNSLLKATMKTNPMCISTCYIESIIFGKLTIQDVEKIAMPAKMYRKNKEEIDKILDKYPHLELITN